MTISFCLSRRTRMRLGPLSGSLLLGSALLAGTALAQVAYDGTQDLTATAAPSASERETLELGGEDDLAEVKLAFGRDTSDDMAKPDQLTVLIDGEPVSTFDSEGRLALSLAPGEYDLQVKLVDGLGPAGLRQTLFVGEEDFEESIHIKGEGLALLGDYEFTVVNADADGVLDPDAPVEFRVIDPSGEAIDFGRVDSAYVNRIETGSFYQGAGGRTVGSGLLLKEEDFDVVDKKAVIRNAESFRNAVEALGRGEYQISIDLFNDTSKSAYHGVLPFRFGNREAQDAVISPP